MNPAFLLALSSLPPGSGTPGSQPGPGGPAKGGAFSRLLSGAAATLESQAGVPAKPAGPGTARSLAHARGAADGESEAGGTHQAAADDEAALMRLLKDDPETARLLRTTDALLAALGEAAGTAAAADAGNVEGEETAAEAGAFDAGAILRLLRAVADGEPVADRLAAGSADPAAIRQGLRAAAGLLGGTQGDDALAGGLRFGGAHGDGDRLAAGLARLLGAGETASEGAADRALLSRAGAARSEVATAVLEAIRRVGEGGQIRGAEVREAIAAALRQARAEAGAETPLRQAGSDGLPAARIAVERAGSEPARRLAGSTAATALLAHIAGMRNAAPDQRPAAERGSAGDRGILLHSAGNRGEPGTPADTSRAEPAAPGRQTMGPPLPDTARGGNSRLATPAAGGEADEAGRQTGQQSDAASRRADAEADADAPWQKLAAGERRALDAATLKVKGADGSARTPEPAAQNARADAPDPAAIKTAGSSGSEKAGPEADFRSLLGAESLRATGKPDGLAQSAAARSGSHAHTPSQGQTMTPGSAAEQVALQIQKGAPGIGDRITLHLVPRELGSVEIRLEMREDAAVRAVVLVDRAETLELLQRDARGLERALNNAGLRTDSGSLNFDLRGQGQGNGGNGQAQANGQGQGQNQGGSHGETGPHGPGGEPDDGFAPLFDPAPLPAAPATDRLDIRI